MPQFPLSRVITSVLTGLCAINLLTGGAIAQEAAKQIHVSGTEAPLDVQVSMSKAAYDINEPIVLRVTLNRDAYVYLFNVPDNSPTAIQLFPNRHEGGQLVVANQALSIPSKSVFRSDRAGTEKLLLVASSQPLALSSAKSMGEFASVEQQEVDALSKQIRVDAPAAAPQRLVKQMEVVIRAPEAQSTPGPIIIPPPASDAAALLTTDKLAYGATEQVTITYGADTKGHLAIYLLSPSKQVTLLDERSVERNKTYKFYAQAIPPTGEHVLLAVFHKRAKPAQQTAAFVTQALIPEQVGKDLGAVPVPPDAYTMHRFITQ